MCYVNGFETSHFMSGMATSTLCNSLLSTSRLFIGAERGWIGDRSCGFSHNRIKLAANMVSDGFAECTTEVHGLLWRDWHYDAKE